MYFFRNVIMWVTIHLIFYTILVTSVLGRPPAERLEVVRSDHLDGLPLERDGTLNKDFRNEVVFGQDESSSNLPNSKNVETLISEMFKKADKNLDGKLSKTELKDQIIENTRHHLEEGRNEAERNFAEVDRNGDNIITWDEYFKKFIVEKGLVESDDADKHKDVNFNADSKLSMSWWGPGCTDLIRGKSPSPHVFLQRTSPQRYFGFCESFVPSSRGLSPVNLFPWGMKSLKLDIY